jgi:hypothetical protein
MQSLSRIVALAVVGVMVATCVGMACLLPVSAALSPTTACHSAPVPSHSHPGDYRCCVSRHPSALPMNVFSPRPALQVVESDAVQIFQAARESNAVPSFFAASYSPPGVVILRV